jgi:hypothetical protein
MGFLGKPFQAAALTKKVRQMLAEPPVVSRASEHG